MEKHPYYYKAGRVLSFIKMAPEGRTLKEIQTYILEMNGRQKWIDKGYLQFNPKTGLLERTKEGRGYWCDFLYGTSYYKWSQAGFLYTHCTKLPTGRWVVTEPIVGPFRGKQTKSLQGNRDRERGANQRYLESLPKCPGCERPLHKYDERTPDKTAHINQWSSAYSVDCKDRVWQIADMEFMNKPVLRLTNITKSGVWAAHSMATQLYKNDWDGAKQAIWKYLGENVIPYLTEVK